MATDLAPSLLARFSIGRVLVEALGVFRRSFLRFLLIALALELLLLIPSPRDTTGVPVNELTGELDWWWYVVDLLAALVINGLRDAALIFGTLQLLRGYDISLGDLLRGLRFTVPIIGIAAFLQAPFVGMSLYEAVVSEQFDGVTFVIGAGAIAFVVISFLAAPSIVAERIGILAALKRSAALTKGKRWKLFALIMLCIIVSMMADFLVERFGPMLSGAGATMSPTFWFTQVVSPGLLAAFMAILSAVSYHAIRIEKEGAIAEDLVQVFD
jgi:hypothetical protein